ncbi:MAG: GntR family transcriptional regulator [Defluviitaleaceae bacterium]|nr:GntR family transcriptional regulator [Defluviitaleaceae bacterium]
MRDFETSKPIFQQIIDRILLTIAMGELAPGEKMPSVRELALEYRVNPNTMQKSLLKLEEMGYLHTQRAVGRQVTTDTEKIAGLKNKRPVQITEKYLLDMLECGVEGEDILKHIRKVLGIPETVRVTHYMQPHKSRERKK